MFVVLSHISVLLTQSYPGVSLALIHSQNVSVVCTFLMSRVELCICFYFSDRERLYEAIYVSLFPFGFFGTR